MTAKSLIKLIRVKQWVKNLFIFSPLFFSRHIYNHHQAYLSSLTFIAFCFLSSAMYVLNDLLDRQKDKFHPHKKDRPLTDDTMSVSTTIGLIAALFIIGIVTAYYVGPSVLGTAFIYVVLNVLYNLYFKTVMLLDVITIAAGFVVRVWAGGVAIAVAPSQWLQLCAFLLALFLGFSKRQQEKYLLQEKASSHRDVLEDYNRMLLDQLTFTCGVLTIVFYGIYTLSAPLVKRPGGSFLIYSIVFVIYGIFRYLYLIYVKRMKEDPADLLFTDKPFLINIMMWLLYNFIFIYHLKNILK